ncbi:NAD-dependent epimerase/dehydratase family protein [Bacillus toyonensis]|nr:NAD-dependent epimerase/dehydratase family protein [Bacillus toyonensis]
MRIAISGGTGFIGKYLSTFFIQKGYNVYVTA